MCDLVRCCARGRPGLWALGHWRGCAVVRVRRVLTFVDPKGTKQMERATARMRRPSTTKALTVTHERSTLNALDESKCRIRAAAARPPARGPTGDGAGRRPARPAARRCPCRARGATRQPTSNEKGVGPCPTPTSNEGGRFLPYPLRPTNVQPLPRWRTARSARRNAVAR